MQLQYKGTSLCAFNIMEVVEKVFWGLVLTELSLPEQSGDMTSEIVVILAFDTFKI